MFDNAGERYVNKRSAMYGALRAWLKGGALPQSPRLRDAMLSIRYTINKADQIQLLSKEDILADNPDIDLDTLDALALTFGGPLAANPAAGGDYPASHSSSPNTIPTQPNDFSHEQRPTNADANNAAIA